MNYNYTACCWFSTSSNILILPSQFWQIRYESCWLYSSKCRILVVLRYMKNKQIQNYVYVLLYCEEELYTILMVSLNYLSSYIQCHIRGSIHSINKWWKENKCFQILEKECFLARCFSKFQLVFPFAARQPQILVSVYHYADKYLRALITMLQIVVIFALPDNSLKTHSALVSGGILN